MIKSRSGFTIVELLIVIMVVGILAAITAVAYNGMQPRAHDVAVRSDLDKIRDKLEIYHLDNGAYPFDPVSFESGASGTVIKAQLESIDMKLTTGSYKIDAANTNLLYLSDNIGSKFALLAVAKGGTTIYVTSEMRAAMPYTATGSAAYPGGGIGGIASNLNFQSAAFYYIYTRNAGGFRIWA